jgi:hypothetical protein
MKHANRASLLVDQYHRQTIRRLHRQQNARRARDQTIARQRMFRQPVNAMNQVRMNLPQRHNRPAFGLGSRAELLKKGCPISLHRCARIMGRESQVQLVFPIRSRKSTRARREPSNQPGEPQVFGSQNLETGRLGGPSRRAFGCFAPRFPRHMFMIATAVVGIMACYQQMLSKRCP